MKNLAVMKGYLGETTEFLIMENGSELLKDKFDGIRYFHRDERGLGWALREGIRNASCKQVFFLPADLSYDLTFVKQAQGYLDTGYDMVLGSKAHMSSVVDRPFKREMLSFFYNGYFRLRYGPGWPHDITGVKAWKKWSVMPLLQRCKDDGIHFEVELMREALKEGLRSIEIAVIVQDFRPSRFNPFTKGS
jgi:glycosyltransferase involved in cell wall biosynthesis